MTTIDLTPFYRNTIGFDHLSSLLDAALTADHGQQSTYPPYNIEATGENDYELSVAVAGFSRDELEIEVENAVLTVRGQHEKGKDEGRTFLHKGIASRSFVRTFNLAEHVHVTSAEMINGLLVVRLHREVPEALKARRIPIGGANPTAPETARLEEQRDVA